MAAGAASAAPLSRRGSAWLIFSLLTLTYAFFYQAGGWNQNSRFALVRALVHEGRVSIDTYHRATGDHACRGEAGKCKVRRRPTQPDEHYYCDKAPGASFLGVLPYGALNLILGAPDSQLSLNNRAWFTSVIASAIPGALIGVFLFLLLVRFGIGVNGATALALVSGTATLLFPYSTLYYGHVLSGSMTFAGLYFAVLVTESPDARTRNTLVLGAFLGMAGLVAYPTAVPIAILCGYTLWKTRDWRVALWIGLGALPFAVAFLLYHNAAFGGPLKLAYGFSTDDPRHAGVWGIQTPKGRVLLELLFFEYRGLFWTSPLLLLSTIGAVIWWRQGRRALTLICGGIFLFYLLMNSSMPDWYLGWSCGPRALVASLPFLLVLTCVGAHWAWRKHRVWRVILALAVVWSLVCMFAATAVRPEVTDRQKRPYTQHLLPALARADFAQSHQSIDEKGHGGGRDAWNLGMKLGLPRPVSPYLLVVLWGGVLGVVYRKTLAAKARALRNKAT